MFNIGFSEFIVIAIVIMVTMDVKKVPEHIKLLRNFYIKVKLLREEIINYFMEEDNYHITGEDGKIHKVYPIDIKDAKEEKLPDTTNEKPSENSVEKK